MRDIQEIFTCLGRILFLLTHSSTFAPLISIKLVKNGTLLMGMKHLSTAHTVQILASLVQCLKNQFFYCFLNPFIHPRHKELFSSYIDFSLNPLLETAKTLYLKTQAHHPQAPNPSNVLSLFQLAANVLLRVPSAAYEAAPLKCVCVSTHIFLGNSLSFTPLLKNLSALLKNSLLLSSISTSLPSGLNLSPSVFWGRWLLSTKLRNDRF